MAAPNASIFVGSIQREHLYKIRQTGALRVRIAPQVDAARKENLLNAIGITDKLPSK